MSSRKLPRIGVSKILKKCLDIVGIIRIKKRIILFFWLFPFPCFFYLSGVLINITIRESDVNSKRLLSEHGFKLRFITVSERRFHLKQWYVLKFCMIMFLILWIRILWRIGNRLFSRLGLMKTENYEFVWLNGSFCGLGTTFPNEAFH